MVKRAKKTSNFEKVEKMGVPVLLIGRARVVGFD
ncbi:unnamed protein product, partial [marine sediment metagenome]